MWPRGSECPRCSVWWSTDRCLCLTSPSLKAASYIPWRVSGQVQRYSKVFISSSHLHQVYESVVEGEQGCRTIAVFGSVFVNLSNFIFVDVSSELSFTVRSKERVVDKSSRWGHMKYSRIGVKIVKLRINDFQHWLYYYWFLIYSTTEKYFGDTVMWLLLMDMPWMFPVIMGSAVRPWPLT